MATKLKSNHFLGFAVIFGVTLAVYLISRKAKGTPATVTTGGRSGTSANSGNTSQKPSVNSNAGFPIGMGSSGTLVGQLQGAIIRAGGKLPKYGVDQKFGAETQAALKSTFGMTSVPDRATFDYILQGKSGTNGYVPNAIIGINTSTLETGRGWAQG